MRFHTKIYGILSILVMGGLLSSCQKTEPGGNTVPQGMAAVEVNISADGLHTRSFANDNTHHVNRIVVIPFRKISESLPNDDQNYVPAYTLAVQKDITSFPSGSIVLHLPIQTTYKLLVVGYNQTDYNYNDRSNPANRFDIGSVASPTTLANFHLYPKSPTAVPEFFTCVCMAYSGASPVGTAFRPEQGYTLSGTLNRIVSGFSLSITNIPTFVKSVSLVAENLTKASKATDASIVLSQTIGDGGNRMIDKKTPSSSWSITFNEYLLPTFSTYATGFFLDVEYGAYTQRYTVKVPDSVVSSGNKFILNPNHAINISGDYSSINIGFNLSFSINLDDNAWDGLQ